LFQDASKKKGREGVRRGVAEKRSISAPKVKDIDAKREEERRATVPQRSSSLGRKSERELL